MDITIDDASPVISYHSATNGWINDHSEGTVWFDPDVKSYSLRTFHKTMTDGDSMEFRFNGTGIGVYGAKRFNHGVYGVKLDDSDEAYLSGYAPQPIFQSELYKRDDLSTDREHVIVITNYPHMKTPTPSEMDDSWLDLDYVTITGPGKGHVRTTTVDDNDASIVYGPNWATVKDSNFRGGTSGVSQVQGSTMELTFNGSSIELFGGANADHGNYSVSIDGGAEVVFSATNWERLFQLPKYLVTGLSESQHTLRLTNLGPSITPTFGFDYALIRSVQTPVGGNPTASSDDPSPSASSSDDAGTSAKPPNVGAIAGGVVGGVIGLALVALLAWFLFRPKRGRGRGRTSEQSRQEVPPRGQSFIGYPASPYSDFEPKFPQSRAVDVAPSDSEGSRSSLGGRFRHMFGRVRSNDPEHVPGVRSTSPEGSVAYFYAPNPNAIPAALSDRARDDDTIIRSPPSDLPRSAASAGSVGSMYSSFYLDDTPTSQRTGMATTATPIAATRVRPRPTSIPSFNSLEGSSDYSHIPLPPLPRINTTNLPTRPGTSHTERSSVLLPPTAIETPVVSGRTFGQVAEQTPRSVTTPSTAPLSGSSGSPPSANVQASNSSENSSAPRPFRSDYKASLLNLPYTPDPASVSASASASASTSGTSEEGDVQALASAWRVRIPSREERVASTLISPPPDYLQAIQASPDSTHRSEGRSGE